MQGEGRMKTSSFEDAIVEFKNVVKRYPNTQTRYQAQFRQADALVALKRDPEALTLLQTVVKEESTDWSPQALSKIGEIYEGEQKYSDAFRSYRQIITDYPDSPMVDHAYFAIGSAQFRLGHFELAAEELEKVGTAYASRVPEMQRVSPGEPLYVRIEEPNLVANGQMKVNASIKATSGDSENVTLVSEAEGGDMFICAIPTALGDPKPGDGILELHGSDTVTLTYQSRYIGGGAVSRTVTMPIASNARMELLDGQGNEVGGVVVGDELTIQVDDADMDVSDKPDTVSVDVTTRGKDSEKLTLTETGAHTGVFRGSIKTGKGTPAPGSGVIESSAGLAEGSATQLDDAVTITYMDVNHLASADTGPRKVQMTIPFYAQLPSDVSSPQPAPTAAAMAIKTLLYKGRSLVEIASTYRDLGMDNKATLNFRKAADQFQEIIDKYPSAPEVEDALYGLFQDYTAQDEYDSAIAVITQITRRFPQSSRASQALFELASLHVQKEEYDRALQIYQSLIQRAKGTPLAEEAQYAICTTYMAMAKPTPGSGEKPAISKDQIVAALDEFARAYPNSDRTPDALWQLVRLRYDGQDYSGAVDSARRMVALYPDNVLTGRVLLLEGQAQYKNKDIDGAADTFRTIIANYGSEADTASKLLNEIERKYHTGTASTTAGTGH